MTTAPPRPPVREQPRLLMAMFRNPQPILDQLRSEYGPVVALGFGPAKLAIVGGPEEVRSLFIRPVEDFRWNHKFNALAVVVGSQSMMVDSSSRPRQRDRCVGHGRVRRSPWVDQQPRR